MCVFVCVCVCVCVWCKEEAGGCRETSVQKKKKARGYAGLRGGGEAGELRGGVGCDKSTHKCGEDNRDLSSSQIPGG